MQTLPETFKHCETRQIDKICPLCKAKLNQKRLEIDDAKFGGLKEIGITHKAVNFCSNPECVFLEQGIVYVKEELERFLDLKRIDALMEETIDLSYNIKKSNKI